MLNKIIQKSLLLCLLLVSVNYTANAQAGGEIQTGIDVLHGEENTSARFQIVNSYTLSPRFSAGLGAGFTYYNDPLSLLPVFADLKYDLTRNRFAPYIFLRAGYNFSILTDTDITVDNHRGGLMLNPGVGLQFKTNSSLGWHLSVGYNLDKSKFEVQEGDERTIKTDITYKRLMAGFGLSF